MNYDKLTNYISRELNMHRNDDGARLYMRREDFRAVKRLLSCAKASSEDFTKLKGDRATMQVMNDLRVQDFETLQRWAEEVKGTASILVKLKNGNYQALTSTDYDKLSRLHRNVRSLTLLAVMDEFVFQCGRSFRARNSFLTLQLSLQYQKS